MEHSRRRPTLNFDAIVLDCAGREPKPAISALPRLHAELDGKLKDKRKEAGRPRISPYLDFCRVAPFSIQANISLALRVVSGSGRLTIG